MNEVDPTPVDAATREHRAILAIMAEIEGTLENPRRALADAQGRRHLLETISGLRSGLREHFELEESEELLGGLAQHGHEVGRLASELMRQHRDFAARLDRSVDEVGGADAIDGVAPRGVVRALRELFTEIREHERRECELFERLGREDIHG